MEKLNEILNTHKLAAGLILLGAVLIIGGLFSSGLLNLPKPAQKTSNFPSESKLTPSQIQKQSQIKVDISGAVENPGVYNLNSDSRVEDAVKTAGGFSDSANKNYISKSLNLSQKISDGIKIYIPFEGENTTGLTAVFGSSTNQAKVSLNNATQSQLEDLPGIGPVSAQKIIQNRPYSKIEDLIERKVVSASVFSKIKDLISE